MVNVLLVDDQAPFRSAARAVIERIGDFVVVGEADSGETAVELAASLTPDLVLMDINMGEVDGIDATRRITADRPGTSVVLVSTYTSDEVPGSARHCGAIAYVNKDELSPRLLRRLWEQGGDPDWLARAGT